MKVQTFPTTEGGLQAAADQMREISKRKDAEEAEEQEIDAGDKPPGQVAYEAYEQRYAANFHKHHTEPWETLSGIQKDAWGVAAIALQKVLPTTTIHVETDPDHDREKRAWALACTKCSGNGDPIKGEGEYANAKYCRRCDVLFGWQNTMAPVNPHG